MFWSFAIVVLLGLLTIRIKGHRSLPSGILCGSQFSSPDSALEIPNPKISWASYGIYTCDDPVMWFDAYADENQELHFTALVPVIERFEGSRMSVAIIGPGLGVFPDDAPSFLKEYATEKNIGGVIHKSPEDQSTCDHLKSVMIQHSDILDDRCHFHEPYGDSHLWVVLDEIQNVSESGSYKIAVYEENGSTAKASFACCDWPEDFTTPYNIPESICPLCGSNSSNPAWSSLFYEHKTMEEYGGFPSLETCTSDSSPTVYPSGEECPSITSDTSQEIDQPESCTVHCDSEGECHSHNAFGGCTYSLDWAIPEPKFGEATVKHIVIFKGDTIRFTAPDNMPHNLYQMTTSDSLDACDFEGSVEVANVGDIFTGYDVNFDDAGMFYYSCSFPNHCSMGQKLTVEVKDITEGLKCHDHEHVSSSDSPLVCPSGQENAMTVNNPDYGSSNEHECAEFCTPAIFINMMTNVQLGKCSDNGFVNNTVSKTVKPPGSPMDIEMKISNNLEQSSCHCHSYEQIPCPGLDDDTLYNEHIEEIELFCSSVLNGEDDCPYKCFQPMEVLHLHYLECPNRLKDPTYEAVDAINICHIAVSSPDGVDNCEDFINAANMTNVIH